MTLKGWDIAEPRVARESTLGPHIEVIIHVGLAKTSVVASDDLPEEGHPEHSDRCMQWGLAQPPVLLCTLQTAH